MSELADEHDLGSCAARREGSIPSVPILQIDRMKGTTKLKIDKTIEENHEAKLVVEVEPEKMDSYKRRAARKISQRGKIP